MENFNTRDKFGYETNKSIKIKSIKGIYINKFRSLEEREITLGKNITLFSGRNGTMKTSLMGLIAHPFNSDSLDIFNQQLKTPLSEIFKLSLNYDKDQYNYDIKFLSNKDENIKETIKIYKVGANTNRHRIVASGGDGGDGNFTLNTSFLSLKRLYPLAETKSIKAKKDILLSNDEIEFVQNFYQRVLSTTNFNTVQAVSSNTRLKNTFGPNNSLYNFEAISSGEDNLGGILSKLLSFKRLTGTEESVSNGVLCIDEIESSLHPVAQNNLFDFLYDWSKENNIQILISTHSLSLIKHIYNKHLKGMTSERIVINFISKAYAQKNNYQILKNPDYSVAHSELTLTPIGSETNLLKVNILCEDDLAVYFLQQIIKKYKINLTNKVDFIHQLKNDQNETEGTGFTTLISLAKNFNKLLTSSIIVFDADVTTHDLKDIKDKNLYCILPDADKAAIERRLALYIINLESDNEFFKELHEKEIYFHDLTSHKISLDYSQINDKSKFPTDLFKNWLKNIAKQM